ncbi:uncharacterized protein HKW66_Vig0042490 [Vigna angularis]|uniref:Uncharacterized protein n=1 Tax=Phaseolus angularis TaxID=3914 RepID=A0A8T0KZ79_PHAAN|nr:uncharacterized protein HKW66_Vig0042490 [Vigna angularis]
MVFVYSCTHVHRWLSGRGCRGRRRCQRVPGHGVGGRGGRGSRDATVLKGVEGEGEETRGFWVTVDDEVREMKADIGGIGFTQRSIGSGMSQTCGSSSHLASKICGCGERLLVLKANTLKNKGDYFIDVEIEVIQTVTTLNGLMKEILKFKEAYKGRVKKLKFVLRRIRGINSDVLHYVNVQDKL